MSTVIEVDESGALNLPSVMLPIAAPHTRYLAFVQGEQIIVTLVAGSEPLWKRSTPEQWAASLREWADSHKDGPGLSDDAVSRDSIYD